MGTSPRPTDRRAPATDLAAQVVSVGVPCGVGDRSRGEGRAGWQGLLRRGGEVSTVDQEIYTLLFRATAPAPRDALLAWAATRGVKAGAATFERCLERDLLREVTAGGEHLVGLRLQATGAGRGPGVEGSERWRIARAGLEAAEVDALAYWIWALSDGRPLEQVVDQVRREFELPENELRFRAMLAVHDLLQASLACLEPVGLRRPAPDAPSDGRAEGLRFRTPVAAGGEPDPAALLVAVGVPLGVHRHADRERAEGLVRRGTTIQSLDLSLYQVAVAARAPLRRSALLRDLVRSGLQSPEVALERCLHGGLIRELSTGDCPPELAGLRLQTAGVGHGVARADPGCHRIGVVGGDAPLSVDADAYMLWVLSDGRTLGRLAHRRPPGGLGDRIAWPAAARAAWPLLAGGAAHLDLAGA